MSSRRFQQYSRPRNDFLSEDRAPKSKLKGERPEVESTTVIPYPNYMKNR